MAQRINTVLKERPDLAGIVVTHGTARLEEAAFSLYPTIKSDRPVVVVGAQRPPAGISPDGPIDLLSAIRSESNSVNSQNRNEVKGNSVRVWDELRNWMVTAA